MLLASPGARVSAGALKNVEEAARGGAEVIINITYSGMNDEDPVPVGCLDAGKIVCDAVYRAGQETRFIETAQKMGARVVAGDRMLLLPGVQAQRLWAAREPDVEAMNDALT